jgi:molybdopterin/thiamine biosynthesis adenylyltransferase
VAYELAAAGVGHLILAHGGNVKPSDLNRQLLMTDDWIGKPRVESAARRLTEFNPLVKITSVRENITEENAMKLLAQADLVVDCAPLFQERFALNRAAVLQKKPLVECAMYEFEGHLTTIIPGETACLNCLYPEFPDYWKRQFPVFGAVAGCMGCMGAVEAIKHICGVHSDLRDKLLVADLRKMTFRRFRSQRLPSCAVCSHLPS